MGRAAGSPHKLELRLTSLSGHWALITSEVHHIPRGRLSPEFASASAGYTRSRAMPRVSVTTFLCQRLGVRWDGIDCLRGKTHNKHSAIPRTSSRLLLLKACFRLELATSPFEV